ncbi:MAG: META domain-containing protein [Myxococcales bacterium]|nr:META domain-containing protein [Myxococcales bacterium]
MGKRFLTAVCVVAPLAAACGGGTDQAMEASLVGREFLSESVEGRELVADTVVRITFGSELHVYAGCNHLGGPYRVDGGRLHMAGFSSTEIGCNPELAEQDDWLQDLLTGSPSVVLDEPRLTLSNAATRLTLLDRELASPDLPLMGIHWIANGIGDEGAVTSTTGGMTMSFREDGTVEFFTGCQQGSGDYSADDTTISVRNLVYDGANCSTPTDVPFNPHTHLLSILDAAPVSYEIEEDRLTISGDGRRVIFVAEQ